MSDYALEPIGYVRNPFKTFDAIPYQGAPSILELRDEYRDAGAGLEPGYIWVITWLHLSERSHARFPARPADVPGGGRNGGTLRGSFSSRTPVRLNPIGVTAARLLDIQDRRLEVDALDLIDGTPLLDVKPYVREFDCIFGPADPAWKRAASLDDRLARIVRTIERFCGPLTPTLAVSARIALAADRDLDQAVNSPSLSWICRCDRRVAAGIQAVSGAPLGSARFELGSDESLVQVTQGGSGEATYRLRELALSTSEVLTAAEDTLMERQS